MTEIVDLLSTIVSFYLAKSAWELLAVFLAIVYLSLAMKESIWCWPAALISTAIYMWLFWGVSLVMDSLLQVYYIVMALYGWWMWRTTTRNTEKSALDNTLFEKSQPRPIITWHWPKHIFAIVSVLLLSVISGFLLNQNTNAAWPFLDSFTTWGSVLTTYMVTKKVLENWLYWIVIDSVAVFVYIERGLYPTAALFVVYVGMVIYGYFAWKKLYNKNQISSQTQLNEYSSATPG